MKTPPSDTHRTFEREALPHAGLLYNYALRMTNNTADAEDLVQETYLKAFRFWDSFEQGTNIRAWLFRILKNSHINRYRKEARQPETVEYNDNTSQYARTPESTADPQDLQDSIFGNLLDDEIASAIAALPVEFRTVVILCDVEGLTYEEVADFVECPLGTVRSRLHRGRNLLRGALGEYARQRGLVSDK